MTINDILIYSIINFIFTMISYLAVYKIAYKERINKIFIVPNIMFIIVIIYSIVLILNRSPYEVIALAVIPNIILVIIMYPFSRYLSKKIMRMKKINNVILINKESLNLELSIYHRKFSDNELNEIAKILNNFFARFTEVYHKNTLNPISIFCTKKEDVCVVQFSIIFIDDSSEDSNELIKVFKLIGEESNGEFKLLNKFKCGYLQIEYLI